MTKLPGMSDQLAPLVRGPEDLERAKKSRALAPTKDVLMSEFPGCYKERFNPKTGRTEWRFRVPLRDRYKNRTRAGLKLQEMFSAYVRSESARARTIPRRAQEKLIAPDGTAQFVEAHLAEGASNRNGWSPAITLRRACPVVRGPGGMLWRWIAGRWMPLGVSCLGTPLTGSREVSTEGVQLDPDGGAWRFQDGEWRTI